MKKRIFMITLISFIILTGCESKKEKNTSKIVENNGMLSYTIDGEKTDIKPTKEDGYIVNKIICDNGSDMMWDNDNWEVELTKVNSKDRCKIDFTKDTSKEGYRVTVTSNVISALDSLSKATTENGTIIIYSKSKIESVTECNGIIEDNKVIISNINSNQTCDITIEETLADVVKVAYPPKSGRTNFNLADQGTPSLYTGTDDQGITYYFSGNGTNMKNWVSFAGSMWRIIRINGNGSIRLLYAGSGGRDGYITISEFSDFSNHPAYVGWKYTVGGSLEEDRKNENKSKVYNLVNDWYTTNIINTNLIKFIDTEAIYCNDRYEYGNYSTNNSFTYATYTRLEIQNSPIFTCSNENDRFTSFGLMTADEVIFAGGSLKQTNNKAYYYLDTSGNDCSTVNWKWWTMSPYYFYVGNNGTSKIAGIYGVYGGSQNNEVGRLNKWYVSDSGAIRPVISLKKEVVVTSGDGSANSPYEITLN